MQAWFIVYQKKIQRQVDKVHLKNPSIPYKISLVLNDKMFSKHAYKTFVEKLTSKNAISNERLQAKWIANIGEFTYGTVQKTIEATSSTYFIYLHFRIINRIYATNRYLFNIKVMEHDKCTFCEEVTETIVHLFWQCPVTQILIKEILSHLKAVYNIYLNISAVKWFLLKDLSSIQVLIVTLIKAHIHKSRLNLRKPSVEVVMQSVRFEIIKEYHIAKINNKMDTFEHRWGELRSLLS